MIRSENDLRRCVEKIWKESFQILGEDPDKFPRDDRWIIKNNGHDSPIMQWDTGLTAIFRQGTGYTIPVEVVWKMPMFYAWYLTDDQKPAMLFHNFTGFILHILGDPKKIEGGLEYIGVVSPPKQDKAEEEEPRWKQRRRNLRSDFPMK